MKTKYLAIVLATASITLGATIPLDETYLEDANGVGTQIGKAILTYARHKSKAYDATDGVQSHSGCPGAGCFTTGSGNSASQALRDPVDSSDSVNWNELSNRFSVSIVSAGANAYGSQRVERGGIGWNAEKAGWRDANSRPDRSSAVDLALAVYAGKSLVIHSFGDSESAVGSFEPGFPGWSGGASDSGAQLVHQALFPQLRGDGFAAEMPNTSEELWLSHAPEPGYLCLLALGLAGLAIVRQRGVLSK